MSHPYRPPRLAIVQATPTTPPHPPWLLSPAEALGLFGDPEDEPSFTQLRDAALNRVCSVYGIPAHLLGTLARQAPTEE